MESTILALTLLPNPAAGVRVIVKGKGARKPKWLSIEQTKALLAEMPAWDADLAYFLAATGCRISEALSALWRDFYQNDNGVMVVAITSAKTEAGGARDPAVGGDGCDD